MWHLELHSLLDFLLKQRLLRHNVLQLHLLYPWPPNSDAFSAHSLNKILTDGTSAMLTVTSVHVLNWFLAYHEFSISSLVSVLYKSLVRSASIITPKIFLESHLPRSISGTQTFTVSPTFPCLRYPDGHTLQILDFGYVWVFHALFSNHPTLHWVQ